MIYYEHILGFKMMKSNKSLWRLVFYIKEHRPRVFLALVCTTLYNICDMLPEFLIGSAVDVIVNKQESFLARAGFPNVITQLLILAGVTLIAWSLESIFEYFSEVSWRYFAQAVQHRLRLDTYAHLQKLDMEYFEEQHSGELLSILNDDISLLERFLDTGISQFIYLVVGTVGVVTVFFILAPSIALVALVPVPLILGISFFFKNRLAPLYVRVRGCAGMVSARIANNLAGITTIKSYTNEEYELKRLAKEGHAYQEANFNAITIGSAFIPVVRMSIAIGFIFTLVLGGWYASQGTLAVGTYSILIFMTQRLLWPLIELAKQTDLYERAMASAKRIFAVLDAPITIQDGTLPLDSAAIKGHIVFNNISFAYPNGMVVFKNLSIDILPGQTVAFVGSTGAGKSTLIKLLLRFYEPSEGNILLDNISIDKLMLHDLRKSIGFVSQDVFLFQGTVYENIAYGSPLATLEQVQEAAMIAEAHEFIIKLPKGYNTVVGERGQKLSGGQRQRISIARALVDVPPIFVFDEATSAVDNETEAAIQRSLDKIAKDRTTIVIAHRLSTIRHADKICVLDKGIIVESGLHDELIVKNGMYAYLWHVQTGQL